MVPIKAEERRRVIIIAHKASPGTFFRNKRESSLCCRLTNQPQDEQELDSVLVEAEVGRLRVHDGADQAAFGCEEA